MRALTLLVGALCILTGAGLLASRVADPFVLGVGLGAIALGLTLVVGAGWR